MKFINRFNITKSDVLFIILAGIVFDKMLLYAWSAYHVVIISSFITNHSAFWGWYMPKIAAALLITSVIYFLKNKKWWILLNVLLDIWIIANLFYLRSYDMPLDAYAVSMVGNMDGFWSSIFPLYNWFDIIYVVLTTIGGIAIYYLNTTYQSWLKYAIVIGAAFLLNTSGKYLYLYSMYGHKWALSHTHILSLGVKERLDIYGVGNASVWRESTPFHSLCYTAYDLIRIQIEKGSYQLSDDEKMELSSLFTKDTIRRDERLIIILVESFDSWVLTDEYMPHLSTFIKDHPCFYANKVKSQVRGGMSADGQMIINTGLLPVAEGAACFRFPNNVYPGIVKSIDGNTICILPHKKDVWNQGLMSYAYGYRTTIESSWEDSTLLSRVKEAVLEGYMGVQMLTLSTHTPYDLVSSRSTLEIPSGYDEITQNYIRSFNYFDGQLKSFLEDVDKDTLLSQATIVITGDHAAPYPIKKSYCPLIIYSPNISSSIIYSDECYQIDIYPTLTSAIKVQPEWLGIGKNLFEESVNRKYDEDNAFIISDKLIRANYFSTSIEERLCPNCQ